MNPLQVDCAYYFCVALTAFAFALVRWWLVQLQLSGHVERKTLSRLCEALHAVRGASDSEGRLGAGSGCTDTLLFSHKSS